MKKELQNKIKEATQALNFETIEILLKSCEFYKADRFELMGDLQETAQDWLEATKQIEKLRIEKTEAKEEIDQLRAQLAQAVNKIDQMNRTKDWADHVDKTQTLAMYQDLEAKHLKLIDELDRSKKEIDWLNHLPSTNEAAKAMAQENVRLQRRVTRLSNRNRRLAAKLNIVTEDNRAYGAQIETKNKKIAELETAATERDQLAAKFETLTQNSTRRFDRIQKQREQLDDQAIQLHNAQTHINNLSIKQDSLKDRFETIAHENKKVSNRAFELDKELKNTQSALALANQTNNRYSAEKQYLESRIKNYTEMLELAGSKNRNHQDTIQMQAARIRDLITEVSHKDQSIDQLNQALINSPQAARVAELELMLKRLKFTPGTKAHLLRVIEQNGVEWNKIQQRLARIESERDHLQDRLEEWEGIFKRSNPSEDFVEIKKWAKKAQELLEGYKNQTRVYKLLNEAPEF